MTTDFEVSVTNTIKRYDNAKNRFVASVCEQFGLPKADAALALTYYAKNRLVRFDAVTGSFCIKHGAFWDRRCLKKAAQIQKEMEG